MSRLTELRARRADLMARCAAQRADLARRLAELRPGAAAGKGDGVGGAARGGARHPLAWVALLGGLMLVTRAREVLSLLLFLRSAGALAVRTVQLLRLFGAGAAPRAAGAASPSATAPAGGRSGRA